MSAKKGRKWWLVNKTSKYIAAGIFFGTTLHFKTTDGVFEKILRGANFGRVKDYNYIPFAH